MNLMKIDDFANYVERIPVDFDQLHYCLYCCNVYISMSASEKSWNSMLIWDFHYEHKLRRQVIGCNSLKIFFRNLKASRITVALASNGVLFVEKCFFEISKLLRLSFTNRPWLNIVKRIIENSELDCI